MKANTFHLVLDNGTFIAPGCGWGSGAKMVDAELTVFVRSPQPNHKGHLVWVPDRPATLAEIEQVRKELNEYLDGVIKRQFPSPPPSEEGK